MKKNDNYKSLDITQCIGAAAGSAFGVLTMEAILNEGQAQEKPISPVGIKVSAKTPISNDDKDEDVIEPIVDGAKSDEHPHISNDDNNIAVDDIVATDYNIESIEEDTVFEILSVDVDGEEVHLVDIDADNIADIISFDVNNNDIIDSDEILEISENNIDMSLFTEAFDESPIYSNDDEITNNI